MGAYGGACKYLQSFGSSTMFEKYKFADSCKAPWPCEDSCTEGHDYDACPKDWISLGAGFCKSPEKLMNMSNGMDMYKFDEMSIPDKQEMAGPCGWEWPCKTSCLQDYSKQCPESWSEFPGLCTAPVTYAGDCGYSINTAGMTRDQKREFALKCAVAFPCRGEDEISEPISSEQNSAVVMDDGPLGSQKKLSQNVPSNSQDDEFVKRFASRFVEPSGPVDEHGYVHF